VSRRARANCGLRIERPNTERQQLNCGLRIEKKIFELVGHGRVKKEPSEQGGHDLEIADFFNPQSEIRNPKSIRVLTLPPA
jgi:hypothetical protein